MSKIKLIPEGLYHFEVIKTEEYQSRTGRYGSKLTLQIIRQPELPLYFHYIWYGNYKDYKEVNLKKSVILWRLAKEFGNHSGIKIKDLLKNNVSNKTFIAKIIIKDDYSYGKRNYLYLKRRKRNDQD
jgi:hypothetical protein